MSQARALPGNDRFMLPELFKTLATVALKSPAVVFLATEVACHAVIIHDAETVVHIRLQVKIDRLIQLSSNISQSAQRGRGSLQRRAMKCLPRTHDSIRMLEDYLHDLWRDVVELIVAATRRFVRLKRRAYLDALLTGIP